MTVLHRHVCRSHDPQYHLVKHFPKLSEFSSCAMRAGPVGLGCSSQNHQGGHRFSFDPVGCAELLFRWGEGYVANGPKDTNQYRYWSKAMEILRSKYKREHRREGITEILKHNPNNYALYLLAGCCMLVDIDEKGERQPIADHVSCLRKAYSMWKHPLVLIVLAGVLRIDCRHTASSLRESLRIWNQLQHESLIEIAEYLPKVQEGQTCILYQEILHRNVTKEIANSFIALCRNRKKMQYLNRGLNLYQHLENNALETGYECNHCKIWEKVQMTITRIRLLFWSGDYHSAHRSVTELMTLCTKKRIKLNLCSARMCYVVFLKLEKYEQWDRALKQQSRKDLQFEDSADAKQPDPEWILLINDIWRAFLALHGVKQKKSFTELYKDTLSRYKQRAQSRNLGVYGCNSNLEEGTFMARLAIAHELGMLHGAPPMEKNVISGCASHFHETAAHYVHRYLQRDGVLNECHEPLCIGVMIQHSFLRDFVHHILREYKMAHYFYQLYHEIDPYDPVAYHYHGFLMKSAGNMERAEKYVERARKLNVRSNLNLEPYEFVDIELDMRDYCVYCGKRGYIFRRCGRCKVMFYCSRLCQKKHWNSDHRSKCVHHEDHELKPAHKLRPFVGEPEDTPNELWSLR